MKHFLTALLAFFLTACVGFTPNKTIAVTSESLNTLSKQLDAYEQRGWIEDKEEDELQYMLLHAHDLLSGLVPMLDSLYCPEAENKEECVENIALKVEQVLRKYANE